ncbi:MAG: methyltransferase domain-containing protein [Candidatus Hodarchaeota archaeon]
MSGNDAEIIALAKGLNSYIRRLVTQVAINEGLPDILKKPKSIIELADIQGYRNLKLLREFIISLASIGVLRQVGDEFEWAGSDIRITPEEKVVEQNGGPWLLLLQLYARAFPRILRGSPPSRTQDAGICDSINATELYEFVWREAIRLNELPKDSVVLDIGCRTGWSTIYLLEELEPKTLVAIDNSERYIDVAIDNISEFKPEHENVSFLIHDFRKELSPVKLGLEESVGVVFVSYLFHWYENRDVLRILINLRKLLDKGAVVVFLQPLIAYKDQPRHFEILLHSEKDYRGYPQYSDFASMMVSAGFRFPKREYNLFLSTYVWEEEEDIGKPASDPPRFCSKCGRELPLSAIFCVGCGTILKYRLAYPLL